MALLLGYGAAAINPYLAFDTITDLIGDGALSGLTPRQAIRNYIKACGKGVLKIMSKMGISTVASYTGAQVFEAIGLSRRRRRRLLHRHGQPHRRHRPRRDRGRGAGPPRAGLPGPADASWPTATSRCGGEYQWRREGEYHLFNPTTVHKLQHSTRTRRYDIFKQYTRAVDDQSARLGTLRGLFRVRAGRGDRARARCPSTKSSRSSSIVKRFSTGAMSYGSISAEAHETLAIAMNRIGGRSNTGEGGEDADRYRPGPQRRPAPQRHQAGGVRPVRRDQRVPGQRRRPPDQDGPGSQARRGRPAARPQGVPVDRQDPVLDARAWGSSPRRPTTTSTPSRTWPSSSTTSRTPTTGPHPRQAGRRGRRRDRGRGRLQGPRRRGAHLRPRRRHRRLAPDVAQARRRARGSSGWPRPSRR